MAERVAQLRLTLQGWTGWSREQPAPEYAVVEARRGQVLGLADFGMTGVDLECGNRIFGCQVRLMTLLEDRAFLEYRRLVLPNPDGRINLSAPATGTVLLRPGQRVEFATPTMDGGLHLTVVLDRIGEPSDRA